MNEWLPFFVPHFPSETEATAFVDECESINPDYRPPEQLDDSTPKIMMHQTVRLISLADKVPMLAYGQPLSLFFMIVCAECVTKLFEHHDFERNPKSKEFVRKFFNEHVSPDDRQKLISSFSWVPYSPVTLTEIADLLYDIRCDVVHEGRYWEFSFPDGTHGKSRLNIHPKHRKGEKAVTVTVSLKEIRDIVVRGCVTAVRKALKNCQPRHTAYAATPRR